MGEDEERRAEARAILDAQMSGDWERAARHFTAELRGELPPDRLRITWLQLAHLFGRVRRVGDPALRRVGELTVVDIPLRFRRVLFVKRMKLRVTFDGDGGVAGVWVLSPRHP